MSIEDHHTRKVLIDPSSHGDVCTGTHKEDPLRPRMIDHQDAKNKFCLSPTQDTYNIEPHRMALTLADASLYAYSNMCPEQNETSQRNQPYSSSLNFNNTMNSRYATAIGMFPLESTTQLAPRDGEGYREFISSTMSYPSPALHENRSPTVATTRPIDTSHLAPLQHFAIHQERFPFLENVSTPHCNQQQLLYPLDIPMQNNVQYVQNPNHNGMNYIDTFPQLKDAISPLQQLNTQPSFYGLTMGHLTPINPLSQFQSPVAAYPSYPSEPRNSGHLDTVATNQYVEPISQTATVTAVTKEEESTNGAESPEDTKHPAIPSVSGLLLSVPVKPLSSYNYFFRFERERLLKYTHFGDEEPKKLPSHYFDHYTLTVYNSTEFQRQLLDEQWSRDPNRKRKHCKSHGRISFRDLAKRIAKNWHDLPKPTRDVFREISKQDHQRYLREMQVYKGSSGIKK